MSGTLTPALAVSQDIMARAEHFCASAPHRQGEYSRRDWGGPLHSLCSYQGKLKPAIAHFLITWFTSPGDRVLDPLAGVGTIPLEARREGRVGIASDLSPLADAVCRAKLEPVDQQAVWAELTSLELYLKEHRDDDLSSEDVEFGLNGAIHEYFHEDTLRELLLARRYFLRDCSEASPCTRDVLRSSLLHILHGNRPYALSRHSHPITPFAPTGPTVYRPVVEALGQRLTRIMPHLIDLSEQGPDGAAYLSDFSKLELDEPVDAVITSPPFSKSVRFWSSNWMRMWFAGWSPEDFKTEPNKYLEVEQRKHFAAYGIFAESMHRLLRPGGLLVMHLGETATLNMAESIKPLLEPYFVLQYTGRESVTDTESHGLRDKGATVAHWYLFATARQQQESA